VLSSPCFACRSLHHVLLALFLITTSALAHELPPEPGETLLINEEVNVMTGLDIREYSLQNDGRIDFKTARQIRISEYNEYWNSIVTTNAHPLFYWIDQNHDGTFRMFVDQRGDGCDCGIVPYTPLQSSASHSVPSRHTLSR